MKTERHDHEDEQGLRALIGEPGLELLISRPDSEQGAHYLFKIGGQRVQVQPKGEGWMLELLVVAQEVLAAGRKLVEQGILEQAIVDDRERRKAHAKVQAEVDHEANEAIKALNAVGSLKGRDS